MREKSLDEFESIFERASIPVLDITEIRIARIAAVLKNDPLDASVIALAGYLKERFDAEVRLHFVPGVDASGSAAASGFQATDTCFNSTAELVGQISIGRSQLIILPEPQTQGARVVDLLTMIEGAAPPVLLLRKPVESPESVFRRVLHALTGNFRLDRNFEYSFSLVADQGGSLMLLHTVSDIEIDDVRDALRVSPDIQDDQREELISRMGKHGERYLKGVVAAGRESPYDVSYRIEVGEVIPSVRRELQRGGYGLLVVGAHREGHSHVAAEDYQLIDLVRDVPVLAL